MFKLLFAYIRGGKTNTAMCALVIVYVLNKYFGVVTSETEIVAAIAVVLGAVGQLHRLYKSDLVQKIIAGVKAKTDSDAVDMAERANKKP